MNSKSFRLAVTLLDGTNSSDSLLNLKVKRTGQLLVSLLKGWSTNKAQFEKEMEHMKIIYAPVFNAKFVSARTTGLA